MDSNKEDKKDSSPTPEAETSPATETPTPDQAVVESSNTPPPSEDTKQTNSPEKARVSGENLDKAATVSTTTGNTGGEVPHSPTQSSENGHQHPLESSPPFLTTGPPTTETACGPGDSSLRVDMIGSDSDDLMGAMNRLSRVSRVLMPIQQIADASTQMYPSLFNPIGASGVIIYSDGSSTDVSGLTIPYFDPIREIAAGLIAVADPAGEQFEWNSLLESDTSTISRPPGHMGEDYYIATYVDPEENSNVLFTSMDPTTEVPYTTLEILDGMEIDPARGIMIARPPENASPQPFHCTLCGQHVSGRPCDESDVGRNSSTVETNTPSHLHPREEFQASGMATTIHDLVHELLQESAQVHTQDAENVSTQDTRRSPLQDRRSTQLQNEADLPLQEPAIAILQDATATPVREQESTPVADTQQAATSDTTSKQNTVNGELPQSHDDANEEK